MYRTTVNQDIATILFTNLPRNLVSLHCTMSGHVIFSSEASPTFGHANANLNYYHYSFL